MTEQLTDEELLTIRVHAEDDIRVHTEDDLELFDAHAAERAALVAQVAELTRERDEVRARVRELLASLETATATNAAQAARVRELTEARAMHEKSDLAGMRGERKAAQQWRDAPGRAAEARVRELETLMTQERFERTGVRQALEAELSQANRRGTELLERVKRAETMLSANSSHWASEVLRALRGQET